MGHAGTLDKFAEGLLLVLFNKGTKLVPLLTGFDKEYIATIRLGLETDTLDPEGDVVGEGPVPDISVIQGVIGQFFGEVMQVPPKFSAIHVNGKRAHRLVRSGQSFEIKPRKITIHSIEILSYESPYLKIKVVCSKGTYIRSLARDIGKACGSRGYLTELVRTKIGPFLLENAVKGDELDVEKDILGFADISSCLDEIDYLEIKDECIEFVKRGGALKKEYFQQGCEIPVGDKIAVFDKEKNCLAFISYDGEVFRYQFVV